MNSQKTGATPQNAPAGGLLESISVLAACDSRCDAPRAEFGHGPGLLAPDRNLLRL
jgi:hypothetical protein